MRYQAYRPPPAGAVILADLPRINFLGESRVLYPCSACGVEGTWGEGWE
jgi:hypothetical protein